MKDQESGPNFQTLLEVITKQLLYPNQQALPIHDKSLPSSFEHINQDGNWNSENDNLTYNKRRYKEDTKRHVKTSHADNYKNLFMDNEDKIDNTCWPSEANTVDSLSAHLNDLEVCDLSEADEQECTWDLKHLSKKTWMSSLISRSLAMDLKKLLFGNNCGLNFFNDDWRGQAFNFSSHVHYGFLQKKGGPCGLLAAVQAKLLLRLLYKDKHTYLQNDNKLCATPAQINDALALTLADILWEAGSEEAAIVTTSSQLVSNKGILESLSLLTFMNLQDLQDYFRGTIKQWESDGCDSCISFLCSVLLSRGLNNVRSDMDDPSNTIIGRHGYCTLEMVNLLLQGRALSNVFDGNVSLNGMELRGIPKTSDIGFLSLFEHYNTCQVGENYKSPLFPLWVVLSESHFTVLFSTVYLDESTRTFDLFYYDSLSRQENEIWLTLDLECDSTEAGDFKRKSDLTPPLELCVLTKWKNVNIKWNGSEPLL